MLKAEKDLHQLLARYRHKINTATSFATANRMSENLYQRATALKRKLEKRYLFSGQRLDNYFHFEEADCSKPLGVRKRKAVAITGEDLLEAYLVRLNPVVMQPKVDKPHFGGQAEEKGKQIVRGDLADVWFPATTFSPGAEDDDISIPRLHPSGTPRE